MGTVQSFDTISSLEHPSTPPHDFHILFCHFLIRTLQEVTGFKFELILSKISTESEFFDENKKV